MEMQGDGFRRLPPALTTATQLSALTIGASSHLKIRQADVDGVLLRLPSLRRLSLPQECYESHEVAQHVRSSLPQVELIYTVD